MRVLFLLLFLALLQGWASSHAYGQTPELRFEHLPEVSPNIYDIHQDRNGFLWFATWEGLYRYDGYELKRYAHIPEDSTSLLSQDVRALYEDRRGTLWIMNPQSGNPGGWNRYEREIDRFTRFAYEGQGVEGTYTRRVGSMYQDASGRYWTSIVDGGLREFDPETGTYLQPPEGASGLAAVAENVFVFHEDRQGTLWMGSDNGLIRYEADTQTLKRYRHDPEDPISIGAGEVPAVLEDSQDRLWVGTSEGGLCRMDRPEGTFSCYRHNPDDPGSLSDDHVQALAESPDGTLWIGTYRGGLNLLSREGSPFRRFQFEPNSPSGGVVSGLQSNQVQAIHVDRSGVLWVGTHGGDVSRLSRTAPLFTSYVPPTSHPAVWDLVYDRAGMLWLPTASGLYQLDRSSGRWTAFRHDPEDPGSLSSSATAAVYEDHSGTIWVGTMGGLNRYDRADSTFTRFTHDQRDPASLSSNYMRRIYEDRAARLWLGTGRGLDLMDRETETFRHFTHDPEDSTSLGPGIVLNMLEDSRGRFWVATSAGGLNLMDRERGTFTRFTNDPEDPASISHNDVSAITEASTGELWVGTLGGLNRFDPETQTFARFDTRNSCLPSDRTASILEDEQGYLWLNTGRGVVRFDPRDVTCTVYDKSSGLATLYATHVGALKTPDGEYVFGSFQGIHGFFPERAASEAEPPTVILTEFRLFNEPVAPSGSGPLRQRIADTEEVVLNHRQNSIGFAFAALDFVNPSKNQYAYRLEGFDEDWIQAGTRHEASYTNLLPGRYTFHVKAANSAGVWNEQGASIRLQIVPPWWRTTWAYIFYGLLLIVGVITVDRVQRRRLIHRERQRAQVTEARLRAEALEAENRRQDLELEKTRALETMNARLEEQAERLLEMDRIRSRFFANISHEFRTPLTLLLAPIRDALESEEGLEQLPHHLSVMERNARRLLRLIGQLLDLSRLESGAMTIRARGLDLARFLRSLVQAFAARAEREEITLQFDAKVERLPIYGERDKLEKVFANLLSNALTFTPPGGRIRVRLTRGEDKTGAFAAVEVRDTGLGIPEEDLERIFDRFHQVDASSTREHGGTGIGLSLAKELVELHGGTITAESEMGFGAVFTVRLPLGKAHLHPEQIAEGPAEEKSAASEVDVPLDTPEQEQTSPELEHSSAEEPATSEEMPLVLIVEDNPDLRDYLRNRLVGRYRVAEAEDGVEGLELARAMRPALIIADVMMPRRNGLSLCRSLKTDPELSHIPVVLLTAKADEASKLEGLEQGADVYLTKPFSTQALLVRVENLIELRRQLRRRYSGEVVLTPSAVSVPSAEAAFLEEVKAVVEQYLGDEHFSVDRLADEIGMSARQLQRRLRKTANLSAAGFIRMMRLERAAQLLEQEAGQVQEVAYRVGFKNAGHFSRLFHQVFGVPPSDYAGKRNPERLDRGTSAQ